MLDNDPVNGFDPFGLQKFEFVIVRNDGKKHNRGDVINDTGAWGSPGRNFTGLPSQSTTAAETTVTGNGSATGHCCNTVVSKEEPKNDNAGSIIVYMTDAPKGTYNVNMEFSGDAPIDQTLWENNNPYVHAGATLRFSATGPGLVLYGSVIGHRGRQSWSDSKSAMATVKVSKQSDRVQVAEYNLSIGLQSCLGVTVTATGKIAVKGHSKIK